MSQLKSAAPRILTDTWGGAQNTFAGPLPECLRGRSCSMQDARHQSMPHHAPHAGLLSQQGPSHDDVGHARHCGKHHFELLHQHLGQAAGVWQACGRWLGGGWEVDAGGTCRMCCCTRRARVSPCQEAAGASRVSVCLCVSGPVFNCPPEHERAGKGGQHTQQEAAHEVAARCGAVGERAVSQ
jgi:hypothetical protein